MYKVMIVDDELIIREGLSTFLDWKKMNCEIVCAAADGVEAISFLENASADIVITDIRMPGKNGLDLAAYIRQTTPHTKLIILSGYSDFKYAQEALRQGAFDFILKTNPLGKVENAVTRAIETLKKEQESQDYLTTIQDFISKRQDELRVKFFQDLIYNIPLSDGEITEKCQSFHIFEKNFYCILIKIRITSDASQIDPIFLNMLTRFLSTIFSYTQPVIFPVQSNQVCMILNSREKIASEKFCTTFEQLYSFSTKYPHYQFKTAISNPHLHIKELNTAYLECCYCFKHNNKSSEILFFYSNERISEPISDSSNRPFIRKVQQYIENNFSSQISLSDIADTVGLNSSYLSRIFKKETGESVTEYLTNCRIEKAKELLKDNNLRLRDISESIGFNDVSYFSNTFKKIVGVSPTEYRTISEML